VGGDATVEDPGERAERRADVTEPREPAEARDSFAGHRAEPAPRRASREPDAGDAQQRELVAFMARGLVDHPDDVSVEILSPGSDASFELHVHPDDLGHVIGKMGRTARSMRLVLAASAARLGRRADLEIAD
jgi:predicted RNA-binding protein YlqC (UPF0109 family)